MASLFGMRSDATANGNGPAPAASLSSGAAAPRRTVGASMNVRPAAATGPKVAEADVEASTALYEAALHEQPDVPLHFGDVVILSSHFLSSHAIGFLSGDGLCAGPHGARVALAPQPAADSDALDASLFRVLPQARRRVVVATVV